MAKFRKVYHQVSIDEYLSGLDDLFPDGVPPPPRPPYTMPWRVKDVPVFPGAIDGVGAVPGVSAPARVVYSRLRRK